VYWKGISHISILSITNTREVQDFITYPWNIKHQEQWLWNIRPQSCQRM